MDNLHQRRGRVKRYLGRRFFRVLKSVVDHVSEQRDRRGRRRGLASLLHGIFAGLVACCLSLREVEELSEELLIWDSEFGRPAGRIPDTTMGEALAKLDWQDMVAPLVEQVRDMNRKGELKPEGLPSVATVDGKDLAALNHDADGYGLMQKTDDGVVWRVRVLRSVLSSAVAKPCIGQLPCKGREGEITAFIPFATWLDETYGRYGLFEILDVDAGFLSKKVFRFVDQELQYGFVAGLKKNQPDLFKEAQRVLLPMWKTGEPEAETLWEAYQGKQIRRRLYRTAALDGYLGWKNLRQVWLVVQETRELADPCLKGKKNLRQDAKWKPSQYEFRYFAVNLPWNRMTPHQIIQLVRNHWAIENDENHAADVQWKEDRPAWCGAGRAVLALGMLRMLAYNLVQHLRKRHLLRHHPRTNTTSPWEWQPMFRLVREALVGLAHQEEANPAAV